ncbi:MAG: nucleotide sugar dehydrogenase, partial [Methanococcoides sp.]|nr:nucleotide sugar dehydrogenase [Methanococcoides sp.]
SEYFKLDPADVKAVMGKDQPVVVDGRNVIKPEEFIDAGFVYRGIGRGDVN